MPLTLRGFSVHVSCEGQELKQYDVRVEGNTISCYIASEVGKVRDKFNSLGVLNSLDYRILRFVPKNSVISLACTPCI